MNELQDAYSWTKDKAEELLDRSTYARPEYGRVLHLVSPVGEGRYQAMFLRDFCYKVIAMPQRLTCAETVGSFDILFENFSDDHVPPEFVHVDGRVEYWCFGPGPLTDNAPTLALTMAAYCRTADDWERGFARIIPPGVMLITFRLLRFNSVRDYVLERHLFCNRPRLQPWYTGHVRRFSARFNGLTMTSARFAEGLSR